MSYFGKYFLSGPDAAAAADYLFSADVRRPDGSVVYTCMLNSRAGVEADLTVVSPLDNKMIINIHKKPSGAID